MSGKKGKHEPEKEGVLATIWDYAKTFLIIFLVVFALNKLVYINAVIPSESMQTTIMKGDRSLAAGLHTNQKIHRGLISSFLNIRMIHLRYL